MALEARILSLLHLSNSEEQAKGLQSLVNEISQSKVATQTSEDLILIANKIFSFDESNQSQVSKALILALAKSLKSLDSLILHHVGSHVLQCLRDRPLVFDDADYVLRDTLFDYYIAGEEFSQAAQILGGVNLDSTVHLYSLNEKVDIYIKCAEAFLEDDATVDAEIFVNKASALINEVDDWTLQLRYRTTFARILDANRKFAEAASRYYELSTTSQHINRDDLLQLLGKAATCALLGKASSQRTRIIGLICKDERLAELSSIPGLTAHAGLITRVHRLQLLPAADVRTFEISLMPHQKAMSADGLTVLQRAVIEHNMLALQTLYANISFEQLAVILSMDQRQVEKIVMNMIIEERLAGHIDQTEGFLFFESSSMPVYKPLHVWDQQIAVTCSELSILAKEAENL